jgi:flagellar basal-body rod modification protein FlgD
MIQPTSLTTTGQSATGEDALATGASRFLLSNDDFLRLLVTQLRFQDPLAPFDQNQLLAQTAQLTSIEQLQTLNRQIGDLAERTAGSELVRAAELIGRTATVSGGEFTLSGGSAGLAVTVNEPGTEALIDVFDAQGSWVKTITTPPLAAGAHTITWNGTDDAGRPVAPGTYSYLVAPRVPGPPFAVVAAEAAVSGFERRGDEFVFRVGTLAVRLDEIVRLR